MEQELNYQITGVTPLLQNNPAAMLLPKGATKKPKNPTAEEDAARSLYLNENGQVYLPTAQFRASLLYGGKGQKMGKLGLPGIIMGSVFYDYEEVLIINPETGEPFTNYQTIDVRTVVIGNSRVPKGRARFNQWAAIVNFTFDDDFITEEVITMTFERAGKISGVGDFRPSTKGMFGRFAVNLIDGSGQAPVKRVRA